jgi:2-hydroxycyclohexanecarboxyl-CoA dehydrogenase
MVRRGEVAGGGEWGVHFMEGLQDKVAIVTGSNGGIGMGIALKLAAEGAKVVINGRDAAKGEAVVQEIRSHGGETSFIAGDVLSQSDMDRLVAKTIEIYGQIDIMVASAGGSPPDDGRTRRSFGPFMELDIADVAELVARATSGKLTPVRAVVPHMVLRNAGSIVFVTSEGGRFPTPGQTAVATYAAGLIMATKVMAKELSRYKVRVNCIAVTLVEDTPSWDAFEGQGDWSEEKRRRYQKIQERAPFGLANPADIGAVAAFLASGSAHLITGATISPTGGLTYS